MTMLDLRRTDQRTNVLANPFWLKSAPLTIEAVGLEAVFFSFPAAYGVARTIIHSAAFNLQVAFNGTPSILLGLGSIPLESSTNGATVTTTDADEYFETTEITEATPGWYFPTTSDFFDMLAAGTIVAITHADSTVPVIMATYTASGTPTTGIGVLYMLVSQLPN